MFPSVGSINLVKHLTNVDFPLPDNPITTKVSPLFTVKDTSLRAVINSS